MIEMKQGEKTGIRTRIAGKGARIDGFKNFAHLAGGQTASPFIEVADDNTGAATFLTIEHPLAQELASLMATLDKTGAEVHVEEMQNGAVRKEKIAAQAAAAFATAPADVVVAAELDGKSRERHVAVNTAAQRAIFPQAALIAGKFGVDAPRLIPLWLAVLRVENLLQRDDVGVKLGKHGGDAVRVDATIEAAAFVYVVGDNAKAGHCWRSTIQPAHSTMRSQMERFSQAARSMRAACATSSSKFAVSVAATWGSRTARFTSSLMPNERLSIFAEPRTLH